MSYLTYDNTSFSNRIFEHDYVTGVLGLDFPLNESAPYSNEFRNRVIQEHLLLEGFFDSFKKLGGQLKDFGLGLRYIIEDPSRIKSFTDEVIKVVSGIYDKMMSWAESTLKFLKSIAEQWKPAEKISSGIKAIWSTIKKLWESTEGMTGWKKALAVIATASGVKYLWGQITESDDGWSEMSDQEKSDYLNKIMDSMGGDLKKVAGESANYGAHSLVTAIYDTGTEERLDEFLKDLKDKASKLKDKAKEKVGQLKDKADEKKKEGEDWMKKLPDDLRKETEARLASLKKIASAAGSKIVKSLAMEAVLGAMSGGIASFMSFLSKSVGGLKVVMSVAGEPMSNFVSKIKNKDAEAAEAEKGKDDPTSKNESYDFKKEIRKILAEERSLQSVLK